MSPRSTVSILLLLTLFIIGKSQEPKPLSILNHEQEAQVRSFLSFIQTNLKGNKNALLSNCQREVLQLIESPFTHSNMFLNSGKGINELGNYDACNADPTTKYITASIGLKGANSFYTVKLGICGPNSCSVDDYYTLMNNYGESLAAHFGVKSYSSLEFNFYIPREADEETLDSSAIAFIAITFVLFGLGLAGTSIDMFKSFWKEHRQKKIEESKKKVKSKYLPLGNNSTLIITDDENQTANDDTGASTISQHPNKAQQDEKPPKSLEFLASFSYSTNCKKLFSSLSQTANPRLDILNGIRVLSMLWVLYGHSFYYLLSTPILNPTEPLKYITSFWYQVLLQATFSVDSFFLLAGFLSAYGFIGELKRRKGRINIPILYVHRYLRIIPLYAFIFFGYWALVRYINNGPVWPDLQKNLVDYQCPDYWWTNMLFINNIVPWSAPAGCFGWSWYLANDFQFFLITPFILLAYYRSRKLGWAVILLTLIGSFTASIVISAYNNFPVNFMELQPVYIPYYNLMYSKPWTRISPYLIGIIVAYTYMEHKEDSADASGYIKIVKKGVNNKAVRFTMYALGLALVNLMIFLPYDANKAPGHWSDAACSFYYAFGRSLFVFGIALIIYPCLHGHNTIVYKILGGTFWTPIARITFAVYLVHPIIMQIVYYGTQQGVYFSAFQVDYFFFANLLISLIAGFLLTLFIETPFMNIHKNFLFKGKESPVKKDALLQNDREDSKKSVNNL